MKTELVKKKHGVSRTRYKNMKRAGVSTSEEYIEKVIKPRRKKEKELRNAKHKEALSKRKSKSVKK
jgi:hypothetical protein